MSEVSTDIKISEPVPGGNQSSTNRPELTFHVFVSVFQRLSEHFHPPEKRLARSKMINARVKLSYDLLWLLLPVLKPTFHHKAPLINKLNDVYLVMLQEKQFR
jgi:hypothetical protein